MYFGLASGSGHTQYPVGKPLSRGSIRFSKNFGLRISHWKTHRPRINADYANLNKLSSDRLFCFVVTLLSSPGRVSSFSDSLFSFRSASYPRKSAAEIFFYSAIRTFLHISNLEINSVRLLTPNLMKIWRRWNFTVCSVTWRRIPI
jgi:hypothetical protein